MKQHKYYWFNKSGVCDGIISITLHTGMKAKEIKQKILYAIWYQSRCQWGDWYDWNQK
jgi:hypothetical protein